MENITIGQVIAALAVITAIVTPIVTVYKFYKKVFSDRFTALENKLDEHIADSKEKYRLHEERIKDLEVQAEVNKAENTLLMKGMLACLQGLKEQGCNGPVTKAIDELNEYLVNKK